MMALAKVLFKGITSALGNGVNATKRWRGRISEFYKKEVCQLMSNAATLLFGFNGQINDNICVLGLYHRDCPPRQNLARFCWGYTNPMLPLTVFLQEILNRSD